LFHPAGNDPASGPRRTDGVQFVFAPTVQTLCEIHEYEGHDLDTCVPTFVLSGLLELNVDTTTLSTSLVGREEYVSELDLKHLDGEYIHISTKLPDEYRREWDGLTVIGGGAEAGYADTPLDCRDDGRVLTRPLNRSPLGLRALAKPFREPLRDALLEHPRHTGHSSSRHAASQNKYS
jgi:hypothetical protein